jgi:hypothetical protein
MSRPLLENTYEHEETFFVEIMPALNLLLTPKRAFRMETIML